MPNVTFVKYAHQTDFETTKSLNGLAEGALYFIVDTQKIYRGTSNSTAVDFTEPFVLVNNTSPQLPAIGSARIGCLYINTDTYEINLKPTSSSQNYTVVVPALSTALSNLNTAISKLTTVYNYKGSKSTYSALPASADNAVGDVWNVEAAYNNYPAGTNFAWNGTTWDALGGSVDLSGYISDSQVSNPTAGDVLVYQADSNMGVSAGWYNVPLVFNHLSDYDSVGGTQVSGECLIYNSTTSKWQPSGYTLPLNSNNVAFGTGANAPASDQVLTYDSTTNKWTNKTFTATINWTEVNGN